MTMPEWYSTAVDSVSPSRALRVAFTAGERVCGSRRVPSSLMRTRPHGGCERTGGRLRALVEVPDFSGWLSSVLIAEHAEHAEDLLDDLVSAHLVEIGGGSGVHSRYRFHDLIREFARERLAAEEPAAERVAAVERALGALQHVADAAHRGYHGGDYVRI